MELNEELPDISDQFMNIYHGQPGHLKDINRYYLAVDDFQRKHGIKAPYSSYESFKQMKSRKHKQR